MNTDPGKVSGLIDVEQRILDEFDQERNPAAQLYRKIQDRIARRFYTRRIIEVLKHMERSKK